MTQLNEPPVALVKTWLTLLGDDSKEVRARAAQMLGDAFGDTQKVLEFCQRHGISTK